MPARRAFLILAAIGATAGLAGACSRGGGESGSTQQTTGHIEKGVGSLTGDQHLQNEGKKDEVVGGVKNTAHDVKDAVHDATH